MLAAGVPIPAPRACGGEDSGSSQEEGEEEEAGFEDDPVLDEEDEPTEIHPQGLKANEAAEPEAIVSVEPPQKLRRLDAASQLTLKEDPKGIPKPLEPAPKAPSPNAVEPHMPDPSLKATENPQAEPALKATEKPQSKPPKAAENPQSKPSPKAAENPGPNAKPSDTPVASAPGMSSPPASGAAGLIGAVMPMFPLAMHVSSTGRSIADGVETGTTSAGGIMHALHAASHMPARRHHHAAGQTTPVRRVHVVQSVGGPQTGTYRCQICGVIAGLTELSTSVCDPERQKKLQELAPRSQYA